MRGLRNGYVNAASLRPQPNGNLINLTGENMSNFHSRRALLTIPFAAILAIGQVHAGGGGLGAGMSATLPEQLVQSATMVDQLNQQIQQLEQQYTMVLQGTKNLTMLPLQAWSSIVGPLQQLVTLVGNAKGLAYQTTNTVAQVQAAYGDPNKVMSNYRGSLIQWTGNLDSQIAGTLAQYGLNAKQFQTTQGSLTAIQGASQSAVGQMQVAQAGNQIASLMVNQLQALQADIQAGNQVTFNAMAARAHSETDRINAQSNLLSNPTHFVGF
jgi:P-type conjugative transfer protein TrbJ